MTPLSGRGGYVPGTPRTIERFPNRLAKSQRRGSRIAEPLAMNSAS